MTDPQMSILIVDDHPVVRRVVARILANLGYTRIREASDGEAALALLRQEKAALIISDLNMPKINGFKLLETVRQTPEWSATPFIILTAELRPASLHRAFQSHATQYIVKPFTAEDIIKKINQLFPGAEAAFSGEI